MQLQHVKSGAFVTVLESAAPVDPECRGVVLDKKGIERRQKSPAAFLPVSVFKLKAFEKTFPFASLELSNIQRTYHFLQSTIFLLSS